MLNLNPGVNMSRVNQNINNEDNKDNKSAFQSIIDRISRMISTYIVHRKENNLDNPQVRTNIGALIARHIIRGERDGAILTNQARESIARACLNNIDFRNKSPDNINATVWETMRFVKTPSYKNEVLKELALEEGEDKQTEIILPEVSKIEIKIETPEGMNLLTEFDRLKNTIAEDWLAEKEFDPQASYDDFIAGWKERLLNAPMQNNTIDNVNTLITQADQLISLGQCNDMIESLDKMTGEIYHLLEHSKDENMETILQTKLEQINEIRMEAASLRIYLNSVLSRSV